jgi:hypothetical protein
VYFCQFSLEDKCMSHGNENVFAINLKCVSFNSGLVEPVLEVDGLV